MSKPVEFTQRHLSGFVDDEKQPDESPKHRAKVEGAHASLDIEISQRRAAAVSAGYVSLVSSGKFHTSNGLVTIQDGSVWDGDKCLTEGGATLQELNARAHIEEPPSRESVVTDSEKAADRMVQDILSDKIDRTGRQAVRKALDQKDAPLVGRAKEDAALGNISRRGRR